MTRRPGIRAFALLLTGLLLMAAAIPLERSERRTTRAIGVSDQIAPIARTVRTATTGKSAKSAGEHEEDDEADDEVDVPEPTVLLCNLWDGEPYDYWKVHSVDQATADWWVNNSANASIVESATSCPGNPPVELCVPYGDLVKLIVVEPWDANWYLANHAGTTKATNGSCDPAEPVAEPTPEVPPAENGETPQDTIVDEQPETPTTVPTTDGDEPIRQPRPERPERPERPDGDVAGSGGAVVSVAQPAAVQPNQWRNWP